MIKKIITIVAISAIVILGIPLSSTASQTYFVSTKAGDYSTKKKNEFWNVTVKYNSSVKYAGKKNVIALGVSTCDLLRAGGNVSDLAYLVYEANAGIAEDSIITVMAAAPVILCPDQAYKFD